MKKLIISRLLPAEHSVLVIKVSCRSVRHKTTTT